MTKVDKERDGHVFDNNRGGSEVAKEIEDIREYLEREQDRLTDSLAAIARQGIDGGRKSGLFDEEDETSAAYFVFEKRSVDAKNIKERLREIERALEKILKGTYGQCDGCGGLIPPERLEVLPEANLCVRCKAKQSKKYP